jgi:elongation factor 3
MSPVAASAQVSPLPDSPFAAEYTALASAASNVEAKGIADSIALALKKSPKTLHALQDAKVVDVILIWASSKSGYERESAPVLVERLSRSLGTGVEGVFIPLIPALLNLSMDKGQPVRSAVTSAINALVKICPAEGSRLVLDVLCRGLDDAKGWRSKVSALKAIEAIVKAGSEEYVANELGHVIPFVERAMHDTKAEVSRVSQYYR